VVGREALAHRLFAVVVTLLQRLAGVVVVARHFRRIVFDVIDAPGSRMQAAPAHALDDFVVADVQLDDGVELDVRLAQGIGLGNRAREAVEQEAVFAIRFGDALAHRGDDDVIGDQFAAVHDGLGLHTQIRAGAHGSAQHVPRRDLRDAVTLGDVRGLGALAGPRCAQKDDAHGRAPCCCSCRPPLWPVRG